MATSLTNTGVCFPDATVQTTAGGPATLNVNFACNNIYSCISCNSGGGAAGCGSNNTFFGKNAGNNTLTGTNNNFFGCTAGNSSTSGGGNNYFGNSAGAASTSGFYNIFLGTNAGRCNTTGSCNFFFGISSGYNTTTSTGNMFIGYCAGYCNTTGTENIFIGSQCAGWCNTTGACNIFIGSAAGRYNLYGCNNIAIGYASGINQGVGLWEGAPLYNNTCNLMVMGNSYMTCAKIAIAWTVTSDIRDKCVFGNVSHGRKFFDKINPIKFAFKDRTTGLIRDVEGKMRYGFSAQEVLEAEGDEPVIVSATNPDKLMLTSDHMLPVVVNAIKELNSEIDALKERVALLESKT
jgi:hypothetical protein